jgi:hypothetical protein
MRKVTLVVGLLVAMLVVTETRAGLYDTTADFYQACKQMVKIIDAGEARAESWKARDYADGMYCLGYLKGAINAYMISASASLTDEKLSIPCVYESPIEAARRFIANVSQAKSTTRIEVYGILLGLSDTKCWSNARELESIKQGGSK